MAQQLRAHSPLMEGLILLPGEPVPSSTGLKRKLQSEHVLRLVSEGATEKDTHTLS